MGFDVSREQVEQAEVQLGVRFPASFVAPMLRNNGCSIELREQSWLVHPFFDDSTRTRLSRSANDIVRETLALRKLDWFPRAAVCIATADNGDCLILLPSQLPGELDARVFHWDYREGSVECVADTFFDIIAPVNEED